MACVKKCDVKVIASEELQKAVAAELAVEDPSAEKAAAIFNDEDKKSDTESD